MKRLSLYLRSSAAAFMTCFATGAMAAQADPGTTGVTGLDDQAMIEQGRYLAVAADCMACHTSKGGKEYAGGYRVASPLGAIYATNITPSKTQGIGNYTEAQFTRALRQGIRADGAHLYPAMPYTSYTQLSDDDVHALYVYFMRGVSAVDVPVPKTELPFPFNVRMSMIAWNLLFLNDERYTPDPSQTEQVNWGGYLAKALAHCSACHTPRNALMGESRDRFFGGGQLGSWYAPNITPDPSGIGGWSDAELRQYLRAGHVAGKGQAAGPMAEAVENSLQYLHEYDLAAMVAYLRTVQPLVTEKQSAKQAVGAPYAQGQAHSEEARMRGLAGPNERDSLKSGAALYSAHCASCHQADGGGSHNQRYPSLFHNTATGAAQTSNLVAAILFGVEREADGRHVLMPRFDTQSYVSSLSNQQIAMISNYVIAQYGNGQSHVTSDDVAVARQGGPRPLLAKLQPFIIWALVAVLVLLLALIALFVRRKKRRRAGA